MKKLLFAVPLLLMSLMLKAWGANESDEGPWAVFEKMKTHKYEIFSVSRDTLTIEEDEDINLKFSEKEQAQDLAEALNLAHEHRKPKDDPMERCLSHKHCGYSEDLGCLCTP